MSLCSFLTNQENEVECFEECAFYNWEENSEKCPFKGLTSSRLSKVKEIYQFGIFKDDNLDEIDEVDEDYLEEGYL